MTVFHKRAFPPATAILCARGSSQCTDMVLEETNGSKVKPDCGHLRQVVLAEEEAS
jgi:hypothetical protein